MSAVALLVDLSPRAYAWLTQAAAARGCTREEVLAGWADGEAERLEAEAAAEREHQARAAEAAARPSPYQLVRHAGPLQRGAAKTHAILREQPVLRAARLLCGTYPYANCYDPSPGMTVEQLVTCGRCRTIMRSRAAAEEVPRG